MAAYDPIADCYDSLRDKQNIKSMFELENARSVIQPLIQNARLLELACGSGFYTFEFLNWGAASVLAVDNCKELLSLGQASSEKQGFADRITFMEADCSQPIVFPSAPFDAVIATWLLAYAPDYQTLTQMFKLVADNLEDDGFFVSVMPPPSEDPMAQFERELQAQSSGLKYYRKLLCEVEDGICTRMHLPSGGHFDSFRLKKSVYESAAKAAGLTSDSEWISPTHDACNDPNLFRSDPLCTVNDFSFLVIRKGQ